jgi:phosphoglycerol transferase
MFYLLGILGMTSVIAWAVNRKVSSQLFLFVFAPVSVLWSTSVINGELRQLVTPDLYNRAGMFTHEVLSKHDRSKLVVGGEELAGLLNVLFYVDDPDAQTLVIPKGAPFDRSVVQYDREWLLLVGDHSVPSDAEAQIVGDGFALFRIGRRDTRRSPRSMALDVDFSHNAWPGVFNEVSGLSLPEDFGRWSDEAEVKLGLSSPLPRSFDLRLTASAFGPNTDLPFSIRIGPEVRSFRLRDVPTDAYFSFTTDGTEKLITISVPKPISPKQLGISSDDRRLGLALRQLSIVSNDK